MEKLGGVGDVTTRLTDAVCDRFPLAPVIVSGYVPAGVVVAVVTAMVELLGLEPDSAAGLKDAPAPAGRPLTLSVTVPLKPLFGVTVTV
jgi:hypothetical protein